MDDTELKKEDLPFISATESSSINSSDISIYAFSDPLCSATSNDSGALTTFALIESPESEASVSIRSEETILQDSSRIGEKQASSTQEGEPMQLATSPQKEKTPYDQEWPQLEPNIRNLCLQLWPSAQHGKTSVEFLAEGGYNKVFAISISNEDGVFNYVLRLPGSKEDIRDSVASFKYVEKATDLPAPRVIFYDLTADNPLQYPYMILNRIPGITLLQALRDGITHEQRLSIAKDLGRFYKKMLSTKNNHAGTIRAVENGSLDANIFARIQPLSVHEGDPDIDYQVPWNDDSACTLMTCEASGQSCSEIMLGAIMACYARGGGEKGDHADRWMETFRIFYEMDQMGLFSNNDICLDHRDFAPRNIMVDLSSSVDSPGNAATVTGILDWDSVMFIPQFLANQPPTFLWFPHNMSIGSNSCTHLCRSDIDLFGDLFTAPPTPEMAEVKRVFEECAGEEYTSKPFTQAHCLADRLLGAVFHEKSFPDFVPRSWKQYFDKWEELHGDEGELAEGALNLQPQESIAVDGGAPIGDKRLLHESALRITKARKSVDNLVDHDKPSHEGAEQISEESPVDAPLKPNNPAGRPTSGGGERPKMEGELAGGNEPNGQTTLHVTRASYDENGLYGNDPASFSTQETPLSQDVKSLIPHAQSKIAEHEKARVKECETLTSSPVLPTQSDSDESGTGVEECE
ncbi:hypothetical protein F5Y05DRAFT_419785 [Hypoxylon sp. FL0543]|nr:hypothetical protein F5Y05DRAFT_419785 [Hypoxylon sp. FL0543]